MKKKSKMSKDTKRLLIIAAVLIVVFVIYKAGSGGTPADFGSGDAPSALQTLPPATEKPTEPTAAPEPVAAPEQSQPAAVETEAPAAPVADDDPGYNEYPEEIEYTDGSSDDIDEYGTYSGAEDVAYYLHVYGHLPDNYITKSEAEDAGWVSTKGNLWDVAYGSCIGGDRFGNREGLLPKGEQYYECDVNYSGGYRGEERLIFTEDGDVYYTCDHYKSFEKLY